MTVCKMDGLVINQKLTKFVLLLVLVVAHVCSGTIATTGRTRSNQSIPIGEEELLEPLEPKKHQIYLEKIGNGAGRRGRWLAPFQLCLQCKCCAPSGDPSTCINMPCCFGIDCELPDKPFGVCAFVPKSCNCTTCAT